MTMNIKLGYHHYIQEERLIHYITLLITEVIRMRAGNLAGAKSHQSCHQLSSLNLTESKIAVHNNKHEGKLIYNESAIQVIRWFHPHWNTYH